MNSLIASRNYRLQRSVFLSGLVCMLMMSACTPDSTPTATSVPTPVPVSIPTIVPSRPCELSPGVTIPLAVTGVAGTGVVYTWHASAGSVIPPDGPTVAYTAPNMAGDVIISVMAQKGDQASTGMITCRVVVTPTPIPSATSTTAPTATPTPAPTATATPLPSRTPPPATLAPPLCEGSTSADLIGKAWAGDPETRLACARLIIDRWTGAADTQQAERLNNGLCTVTPDPADAQAVKQFFTEYYAVNDVGTAWFLRGEALKRLGRTTEARAAYKTVIDKYSCAYAFAADGKSFWRVADAAQGQ